MRVTDAIEMDRILGHWYLTVQGSDDQTGTYTETTVPVVDIIDAIRAYAPELLKQGE